MRRPFLLIVYVGYLERGYGVRRYIEELQKGLGRLGFDVDVLSLASIPAPLRFIPHAVQAIMNIVVPPLGHYFRHRVCKLLFRPFVAWRSRSRGCVGIVFQDVYSPSTHQRPAIAVVHAIVSDNVQAYATSRRRRTTLARLDGRALLSCPVPVATVSDAYRQSLNRRWPGARLHSIPLGLDAEAFRVPVWRPTPPPLRMVFIGPLEPRKNPTFLVDVLHELHRRSVDAELSFIGDGPAYDELKRRVETLRLQEIVKLVGNIPHEHVPQHLAASHLLLLPSAKESFGYVLLEGKLSGVYTLCSDGLEVPPEFCTESLPLKVKTWADRIEEISVAPPTLESRPADRLRERYSVRATAQAVLNTLGVDLGADDWRTEGWSPS